MTSTQPTESHEGEVPFGPAAASGRASAAEDALPGERGWPSVARVRSLQSRLSSLIACALMIMLGAGMLVWYYTSTFTRQQHARQARATPVVNHTEGDVNLPSLGTIVPPLAAPPVTDKPSGAVMPEKTVPDSISDLTAPAALPLYGVSSNSVPQKSPAEIAFERRASGAAFARSSEAAAVNPVLPSGAPAPASLAPTTPGRGDGDLANLLHPTSTVVARAEVIPTRRFLLPKGAFIDCTLETAIDSSLPGMATCITATDTFGVDGAVILLERGTKLIGETRGQVQQGSARVFVLWTQARTPAGIVVPLDSPGTDELGRSGLSGQVDHHFWQRFGAAILISTLDGAVQAAVQSTGRSGNAVIYNPSASEGILAEVLKSTINIAPTVRKNNGDRIQVLVARDLDFRSVYELRSAAHEH